MLYLRNIEEHLPKCTCECNSFTQVIKRLRRVIRSAASCVLISKSSSLYDELRHHENSHVYPTLIQPWMHVYQFAQKCLVNKCGVLIYKITNSRNSIDKCISKVSIQICLDCVNIPTTLIYTYLQVSKGYECTCKRKQLVYVHCFVNKGCPFRKVF